MPPRVQQVGWDADPSEQRQENGEWSPLKRQRRVKALTLADMEIIPPKTQRAFEIEVPPDMFSLHMLAVMVAKRGGGKTLAACNLMRQYYEAGCLDRIILISPYASYESNVPVLAGLPLDKDDVFSPEDEDVVGKITDIILQERKDYDDWCEKFKLYRRTQRELKKVQCDSDIPKIDPDLLVQAYQADVIDKPPEHKYGGHKPIIFVMADDSQSTGLMRNARFQNFVTRHRHIGSRKGDRLGVSLIVLCQNYTSKSGGLPKPIRENCTLLCLWRTANVNTLKFIAQEQGDAIPVEEFLNLYDQATTAHEYAFLTIDYANKEHRFRRDFTHYLSSSVDKGARPVPIVQQLKGANAKHVTDSDSD